MKTFIITVFITVFSMHAGFSQQNGGKGKVVAGGWCSCTGTFCSASQQCPAGQSCTCSCGAFTCNCTPCTNTSTRPSISAEQEANRVEFITLLRSFGKESANVAADKLESAYRALAAGDLDAYLSLARQAEDTVKILSSEEKNSVNAWFAAKNADTRF